jgi:hypothetical protein
MIKVMKMPNSNWFLIDIPFKKQVYYSRMLRSVFMDEMSPLINGRLLSGKYLPGITKPFIQAFFQSKKTKTPGLIPVRLFFPSARRRLPAEI